MGLWEAMTGRTRVSRPNLDALFGVPSAAVSLEAALGFVPTGVGSVCFRAAAGAAYAVMEADLRALLNDDPAKPPVQTLTDDFGFTWLTVHEEDPSALCTDLHAINTTLVEQGFDSGLLCTLVPFGDPSGRRFGLVYLYKQGTFYAFAPSGEQQRDNLLEIQVRDELGHELPMEQDLNRWLAVWGAPGL